MLYFANMSAVITIISRLTTTLFNLQSLLEIPVHGDCKPLVFGSIVPVVPKQI